MARNEQKKRLAQALQVLAALNVPREQQNERSAVTLLALLGLAPGMEWEDATQPLIGVTPIMEFAQSKYGLEYAPNTRETFRRFTLHQFVDAGIAVANPDDPQRAVNSPKFCYQITQEAFNLLTAFDSDVWELRLREFLGEVGGLVAKYAQARDLQLIPLALPGGTRIKLTPGGQSPLVKAILEEFCPRFTPGALPVYVGDTGEKFAFFDPKLLAALGVEVESHGPIPDVVVFDKTRKWLVLVEAVTSHGPMNPKRVLELKELFAGSKNGLVFVTAFEDRPTFKRYLGDIAWETEVWVAAQPDHMIHFNGERFLGPY